MRVDEMCCDDGIHSVEEGMFYTHCSATEAVSMLPN